MSNEYDQDNDHDNAISGDVTTRPRPGQEGEVATGINISGDAASLLQVCVGFCGHGRKLRSQLRHRRSAIITVTALCHGSRDSVAPAPAFGGWRRSGQKISAESGDSAGGADSLTEGGAVQVSVEDPQETPGHRSNEPAFFVICRWSPKPLNLEAGHGKRQ